MNEYENKISADIDRIISDFLKNPEDSLQELKDIEKSLPHNFNPVLVHEIRFRQAQVENILGDFSTAEKTLLRLLQFFTDNPDEKALSKIYNELGNSYLALERLDEAAREYLKCLEILEKIEDFEKMCIPLNNIGQIYWNYQNFEKAQEYYLRSLQLSDTYSPEASGDTLNNLGILAAEMGNMRQAEEYYLQALSVYNNYGENARKPLLYLNLALLFQDTGQPERAGEYHRKAIQGFIDTANLYGEMHSGMNYAGFLIEQNTLEEVPALLERSLKLAEDLGAASQIIQIYDHYRVFYLHNQDYQKAYEFLEKFHQAEVQRLESDEKEKITEVLTKYETEQKDKETALLREKNSEIEKQHQLLDIANNKLKKANLELENRIEDLLSGWHSQALLNQDQENLNGLVTLISGIAHQWKQPLNLIGLLVQNLLDAYEYGEFDEHSLQKFSDEILTQLRYMSEIINDFAYNFKAGQEINIFRITHTLDIVRKLLNKTLELENIQLDILISDDPLIKGRETELIQVFMVILSNAVEVYQSQVIEQPSIRVTLKQIDKYLEITFFNNGSHIESKDIDRIFDSYFSTKKEKVNTGLGLTIARKIISESFQGIISGRNTAEGVEFIIQLPLFTPDN
ncbi:MAG: tetratricopeptide repeat-containing sensor histidine kinase [Candidatus Cloacimonetes bacterium]|nr:tetratricopeptide repeat-containing sensor histidine kinase [Candidatus Cloacimonadota bacterium]